MKKIILIILLPVLSFGQKDTAPCVTLQDVALCGNETVSAIKVGAMECEGDINIGTTNGRIELYNNGNIICRDGSMETCIFIVASDGTISMRNTSATNAELEMKFIGSSTQVAQFDYKSSIETVAYRSDITDVINNMINNAPFYPNDSIAGANGLTSNKIYKSIVGTDVYLKIKQ